MAYITVLIRIRELWAALPVSMSDKHAEWFLVGLNSKFLVSPVALFQLFSLKCISRNEYTLRMPSLLLSLRWKTAGRIGLYLPLK